MPSVIYNISLWRATTVKHRRVDTSLPWSAETRQNDKEKERGARPLRARINLLSSRPSCCCGLDATHKGGKEEEEGFFVVGPFSFFLSFCRVPHNFLGETLMAFGGIQSQGDYISVHHLFLIFLVESKRNWKIPSIGFQFDLLDANETKSDDDGSRFCGTFSITNRLVSFYRPFFFSFLLHSWSIDNLIMASPLVSLEWMQQGNRLPFNRADEGRMGGGVTGYLARISHNELR